MIKKNTPLPEFLRPYFWDVKFEEIDNEQNKQMIIKRLIDRGDLKEIKYVLDNYGLEEIRKVVLSTRDLSRPTGNFWADLLNINKREIPCLQTPYSPIRWGQFS